MFKLHGQLLKGPREALSSRRVRRTAQAASVAGAAAVVLAFPVTGTPILAAAAVAMIWVERRSK